MEIQRYNSIRIFWYFFYLLGICYTIFAIIGSLSGTIFCYLLSGKQARFDTDVRIVLWKGKVLPRFYRVPDTSSNGHFLNQTLPQNGQFLNWGNVWLRKCPFEEVSESSCIFVAVICMRKTVFQSSCFLVGNIWRMILHGSLAIFLLNPKVPYFGQYRVTKEGFREDLS